MAIRMIKNKLKLTTKLFIILWVILFIQVILKLTFNYWQPYIIPTAQLEKISNFIDSNLWLKIIIDKIFYIFNGCIVILCGLQQWRFKNKLVLLIILLGAIASAVDDLSTYDAIIDTGITLLLSVILPLILNYRKWLTIILTFMLSNVYLFVSLWLEGLSNVDNMQYVIKIFFQNDYYIMLLLNYVLFNLLRMKKEAKLNG